jgi:hypothetical protein
MQLLLCNVTKGQGDLRKAEEGGIHPCYFQGDSWMICESVKQGDCNGS